MPSGQAATERNREIPSLCRINILAVLNPDTGFKLGEVKKVPPVYRQIRDLTRSKHALDSGLDSIDLEHVARTSIDSEESPITSLASPFSVWSTFTMSDNRVVLKPLASIVTTKSPGFKKAKV